VVVVAEPFPLPVWLTAPSVSRLSGAVAAANDPTWRLGEELQATRADLRKGNALCQSPDFVVDLILDLTLGGGSKVRAGEATALEEFGLPFATVVDPSCGSGNFLCAAYMRLAAAWWAAKPDSEVLSGSERMGLAQIVLAQVSGVDIDPDCVDLARRRLATLASQFAGIPEGAYPWQIQVACADSLLHGPDSGLYVPGPNHRCEDRDCGQARDILGGTTYAVVVGNPPYITAKDKVKNTAYRARYKTCSGSYSLAVPFCELMFGLAHRGGKVATPAQVAP
jgi:hypothetical protein